ENLVSLSDRRSPTPPSELSTEEVAIHAAQPSIPKHAIPFPIEGLEGTSTAIETVRNLIRKTAPLESNVLVSGPTGSGKERVARAIHRYSARAQGPFVAVNCGALAPGLIESELFGHTKGSFTGASDDRIGYLEAASGGTLFLDEVTELPLEFQVKLLRVLQDRQITPVGASKSVSLDLRLVAATKHDIEERVALGKFREDLMYRVRVMDIALPALRERRADLLIIAKTILKKLAKTSRRSVLSLAEPVVEKFLLHTWPGNIRELENALDHAATLCWGDARMIIELRDLPDTIQFATMGTGKDQQLKDIVRNFEREYIASTVRRLGSKEQAAEVLGLSLATLYRKLGS
ncbi:MAG: sigma-54-dependent Fis family transcriptional regulator, partial [Bdellovibrionales bacterium]|nr:sigma-54-dependent Fis family transcriptional regulator [Bdellovibrionales bacterium]